MKNELDIENNQFKVPKINFKLLFSNNKELIEDYMEDIYQSFSLISDKALSLMEEILLPVPKKYKSQLIRYGEFGQRMMVRMINRKLYFLDLLQSDPERLKSSRLFDRMYGFWMDEPAFSYRDHIHNFARSYTDSH